MNIKRGFKSDIEGGCKRGDKGWY